jgi:hypothetical protein
MKRVVRNIRYFSTNFDPNRQCLNFPCVSQSDCKKINSCKNGFIDTYDDITTTNYLLDLPKLKKDILVDTEPHHVETQPSIIETTTEIIGTVGDSVDDD